MIVAGLVLLLAGGEALVRGAVQIAGRLGLSPLVIGLTIVGFGTSTPELVTSLEAALSGAPGIAVGNVVGSNIANILLILGAAVLLAPIAVQRQAFLRDGAVLCLSVLACITAVQGGMIGRVGGGLLVSMLVIYIAGTILWEHRSRSAAAAVYEQEAAAIPAAASMSGGLAVVLVLAGLALTIFGAQLLVTGAIEIATAWGISETVIGLTIVAVGTSLPQPATPFPANDFLVGCASRSSIVIELPPIRFQEKIHPHHNAGKNLSLQLCFFK